MTSTPINVRDLASRVASWLRPSGPEADVVVSCRVRLARNVDGYPFIARLQPEQALEVAESLKAALVETKIDGDTWWVPMTQAPPVLRLLLRERHLISRDLAPTEEDAACLPGRAVAFGASESIAVMVNEEDHVRLQAVAPGLDLDLAWQRAQVLDRYLETRVSYAHSPRLGYLTGCPTNVGTGLRASVMLHLPALGLVRSELDKVFAAAQRTGLAVRGMHGEGSRAAGDNYQISNQVTLGRTEMQLIDDLRALVPLIVDFERRMRSALLEEHRSALQDRVAQSVGFLRSARSVRTEKALAHLSTVRLGVHLGLCNGIDLQSLTQLGLQVQRGHVQALCVPPDGSGLLSESERDKLRAGYLRQRLAG